MIDLQILTIFPVIATIMWALKVKFQEKHIYEAVVLLVGAFALLVNGLVVYSEVHRFPVSNFFHFLRLFLSSTIVPLAYVYFSRQMGRKWNNATNIVCGILILIVFLPNINIFIGEKVVFDPAIIRLFSINVIKNGELVFTCTTADFVIMAQAIMTVIRMFPAAIVLRKYGLTLSKRMRGFYLWWISAVIFIAFTSFISREELVSPLGSWMFYISYTLLICSIYTLIALRFDLHPVVTKDEGEVVKVDEFIDANKQMAARLIKIMEEKQVYLQHGYSADDATKELGTNRTYFSRMMSAEFGMKFSDLLNEYRVKKAEELLLSTDLNIGDVSYEAGFSDASYMNKKFQQIVGCTPTVYRDNQKK